MARRPEPGTDGEPGGYFLISDGTPRFVKAGGVMPQAAATRWTRARCCAVLSARLVHPACFVVAYVYLDGLAQRPLDGEEDEEAGAAVVGVDSYSVHRLLITAVMVAAKFMDDMHFNNAYFARVGSVEVAEMNGLELELLFALRFRLNVTPDTFARYCAALEGEMLVPPPMRRTRPSAATTRPRCC
ncbi:cyclin-P4-1-like [Panicum miliaceum]|uniref:Cyclin-P4-1-like n=1 Tax=Panicum miliaceum TaxID=4540 RepID=A0A3L6QLC0_PANMI|nr:cyclin-P4-1-like [Panicum miliaceum]